MTFKVQPVPIQLINQIWPKVEPFIKSAEEKFGGSEYTTDQIKVYLVTNTHYKSYHHNASPFDDNHQYS